MKNNYLFLLACCLFSGTVFSQVYVNQSATGDNDGTSWENAYTDLGLALSNSTKNDAVWVAAGIYKPGGTAATRDTFFTFPHDLKLYGGFAGMETTLEERDAAFNVTVLSGDLAGDDVNGEFDDKRAENVRHVLFLTDTITDATLIDGFTIRNGETDPVDGSGNDRRGGGILVFGSPVISNCVFTQNNGHFGGALYPRGSDDIRIENCRFHNNNSPNDGAGIYTTADKISITNSSFEDNMVGDNGGSIFTGADTTVIMNCEFKNNLAIDAGGAIYVTGSVITVDSSSFTGNVADGSRGGAIVCFSSASTVTNSTFENNVARASSAGAIHYGFSSDDVDERVNSFIDNCIFRNNEGRFGGAVACYGDDLIANISNSTFERNKSTSVGGAISNAFGVVTNITDCVIKENESTNGGGGLYSQNDGNIITIKDTDFLTNSAGSTGGALSLTGDNEPLDSNTLTQINLENVIIEGNLTIEQGGGIFVSNVNLDVVNALIDFNTVTNVDGQAGALSINASDSISINVSITNATIAENEAAAGSGINQWEGIAEEAGAIQGVNVLTLQNVILANSFGENYLSEAGDPELISSGGNLSSDDSMAGVLTQATDQNETDPLFISPDDNNFRLQDESPAVNAGVPDGAPEFDLEGNGRVSVIDIGAYENPTPLVSIRSVNTFGQLSVFPNPTPDELRLKFSSEWTGQLELVVTNALGQVMFSRSLRKGAEELTSTMDLRDLPVGTYQLTVSNGTAINTRIFSKQ